MLFESQLHASRHSLQPTMLRTPAIPPLLPTDAPPPTVDMTRAAWFAGPSSDKKKDGDAVLIALLVVFGVVLAAGGVVAYRRRRGSAGSQYSSADGESESTGLRGYKFKSSSFKKVSARYGDL